MAAAVTSFRDPFSSTPPPETPAHRRVRVVGQTLLNVATTSLGLASKPFAAAGGYVAGKATQALSDRSGYSSLERAYNMPIPHPAFTKIMAYLDSFFDLRVKGETAEEYRHHLLQAQALLVERNATRRDPWLQQLSGEERGQLLHWITLQIQDTEPQSPRPLAPVAQEDEDSDEDEFLDGIQEGPNFQGLHQCLKTLLKTYKPLKHIVLDTAEDLAPSLGKFVEQIAAYGALEISKTARKNLSGLLLVAINKIAETEESREFLTTWRDLLTRLQRGEGSWEELVDQAQHFSPRFYGFKLIPEDIPHGTSARIRNLDALRKTVRDDEMLHRATRLEEDEAQVECTQESFEKDLESLIENTTNLATLQSLGSRMVPWKDVDVLQQVRSSQSTVEKTSSQNLKEVLLLKIKDEMVPWTWSYIVGVVKQIFVMILWPLLHACLHYLISHLYHQHAKEVFEFIKRNAQVTRVDRKEKRFQELRDRLVTALRQYLSTMEDVYYQRAHGETPGALTHEQRIEAIYANLSKDLQTIYADFVCTEMRIAFNASSGNPLCRASNFLCRAILKTLRFFHVLDAGWEKDFVESYSNAAIAALSDGEGYKHPINSLLLKLLKQLKEKIETADKPSVRAPLSEEAQTAAKQLEPSKAQKDALKNCVKLLFTVLPKCVCQTKESLIRSYHDHSILEQIHDRFVLPQVEEKAEECFNLILDLLSDEKLLTELVYDSTRLARELYEPPKPQTESAEQTAKDLSETTTAILNLAVKQVADEILDSSGKIERESKKVNAIIANLRRITLKRIAEMQKLLTSPLATQDNIGSLLAHVDALYEGDIEALMRTVRENPLLVDSEDRLMQKFQSSQKMREELAAALIPFSETASAYEKEGKQIALVEAAEEQIAEASREMAKLVSEREVLSVQVVVENVTHPLVLIPPALQGLIDQLAEMQEKALLCQLAINPKFYESPAPWYLSATAVIREAQNLSAKQKAKFTSLVQSYKTQAEFRQFIATNRLALNTFTDQFHEQLQEIRHTLADKKRDLELHREQIRIQPQAKEAVLATVREKLAALHTWATESKFLKKESIVNVNPLDTGFIRILIQKFLRWQLDPIAHNLRHLINSDGFYKHACLENMVLRPYVSPIKV